MFIVFDVIFDNEGFLFLVLLCFILYVMCDGLNSFRKYIYRWKFKRKFLFFIGILRLDFNGYIIYNELIVFCLRF